MVQMKLASHLLGVVFCKHPPHKSDLKLKAAVQLARKRSRQQLAVRLLLKITLTSGH